MIQEFSKAIRRSTLLTATVVLFFALAYSIAMAQKDSGSNHEHTHDEHDEHSEVEAKYDAKIEEGRADSKEHKGHDANESSSVHAEHDEHPDEEKHGHAEEEHGNEHGEEEEASGSIGPGKAVEAVDAKSKRFKLSAKARSVIGVKIGQARGKGQLVIVPRTSVVEFGPEFGVYVEKDGWLRLAEVQVVSRSKDEWQVKGGGLKADSKIVVGGVGLVRVTELDAFGGGGHGHTH